MASLISLPQQLISALIQLGIINIIRFLAHVHNLDFLGCQQSLLYQAI